jgi:hypothetical protein
MNCLPNSEFGIWRALRRELGRQAKARAGQLSKTAPKLTRARGGMRERVLLIEDIHSFSCPKSP